MDSQLCVFCNEPLSSASTTQLTEKGVAGILNAAKGRNVAISVTSKQYIHTHCRRDITNPARIALDLKRKDNPSSCEPDRPSLRSAVNFNFKEDCLFCTRSIKATSRYSLFQETYTVRTQEFDTELRRISRDIRQNDAWAVEVLARVEFSGDLHASDSVYHQTCSVRFRTAREKITDDYLENVKRRKSHGGRTKDTIKDDAFYKVIEYIENTDDEIVTLQDLVVKMQEFLAEEADAYTVKWMRKRLEDHYGDEIMITSYQRVTNVVTLKHTAAKILYEYHKLPKDNDPEKEKIQIMQVASKLLKNDIRSIYPNKDEYYPSEKEMSINESKEFLPNSLTVLLENIFPGKDSNKKVCSIGQAIVQATRPKLLLAPILLGLGVQLHHNFASKYLIETLHNHGFCAGYPEIQTYEKNAACSNNTEVPMDKGDEFTQYSADNVDHNINTIDGHGTFHGMGIIAATTPGGRLTNLIQRKTVSAEEIKKLAEIHIHFYSPKERFDMTYDALSELPKSSDQAVNVDILWKTTWLLRSDRMSWSGVMQMINTGSEFPWKSTITFMPMIDMNPSDETCIYSTLLWVCRHAKRYGTTPVLTFDQPLWYKATMIVDTETSESEVSKVVLRLGGFHAEMSYLGAVGQIMTDSGLQEVLSTVYAEKTVGHMITGKAVSRALRGHGLIHMALNSLIVSEVFNIELFERKQDAPDSYGHEEGEEHDDEREEENFAMDEDLPTEDVILSEDTGSARGDSSDETGSHHSEMDTTDEMDSDLKSALDLFDSVLVGETTAEEACKNDVVMRIKQRICTYCEKLSNDSRTAKLWIQYLQMFELLRDFIRAERIGNWQLHLQTLRSMLPYYAAAGHNLYAKSVYIYLSKMNKLPSTHPKLYNYFERGFHVVRRSNRMWAGLSTDLVIEQALMRSLKSSGGLTRGRGMTDVQRAIWVLSRPATSSVNEVMQEYSGVEYTSSEQHKDTNPSVKKRDGEDTQIITDYLVERNPFRTDKDLRSIVTGVISKDSNADDAKVIGERILERMSGKKVNDFTFRKREAVVPMSDKSAVKIDNDTVTVDPQLLFQRLITVANQVNDEPDVPLTFELCPYPPALFESKHLLREADKPVLAKALKTADNPTPNIHDTSDSKYNIVVDGGMLLQWVSWEEGKTFDEICSSYAVFLQTRYSNCIVVFDGYESGPTPKDATHLRRTKGIVGAEVRFNHSSVFRGKKSVFLTNEKNKQSFINMLSKKLNDSGIETLRAEADADLLIVLTAARLSITKPTILIGEDNDLLVLLCYHAKSDGNPIYLQPKPRLRSNDSWDIQKLQSHLGEEVCKHILFLHAILGCDTTSRVHGIGKGAVLKAFVKSKSFQNAASEFQMSPDETSKANIIQKGEQALVCLFKGREGQTLDNLRKTKFVEKVAKSNIFVDPKVLPPTSDAAKFHSLRVYLQTQVWKGELDLNPEEWGWQICDNRLYPIPQTKPAAPAYLLKVIRCTCATGCRTKACSCKKMGLECGPACATCKGVSCENSFEPDLE